MSFSQNQIDQNFVSKRFTLDDETQVDYWVSQYMNAHYLVYGESDNVCPESVDEWKELGLAVFENWKKRFGNISKHIHSLAYSGTPCFRNGKFGFFFLKESHLENEWCADVLVYLMLELFLHPEARIEDVWRSQRFVEHWPIGMPSPSKEVPLEVLKAYFSYARTSFHSAGGRGGLTRFDVLKEVVKVIPAKNKYPWFTEFWNTPGSFGAHRYEFYFERKDSKLSSRV